MKKTMRQVMPWAVAMALGGTATGAAASGFQLMEQNASGLGASYAGSAAVAEDASTIFFNPAGISFLGGRHNVAVSLNAIKPSARFSGTAVPSAAPVAAVAGALNSYGTGGDAGDWAYLPAMYYTYSVTPSVTVGLGINSPFGLKTHYNVPWVGQLLGIESDLKTMAINPVVSFKGDDTFSIAVGFIAQKAEATLTSATGLGVNPTQAQVKGEDWAYGFNLGALWQVTRDVRLGFNYRSEIKHTLEGTAYGAPLPSSVVPAEAAAELPALATLSGTWDVARNWKLMADVAWTGWSSFKTLQVINQSTGLPLTTTPENWKDSWRFALGASYQINPDVKLRAGIAYDQSPVPDLYRTVRIPDNDRTWLSLGGQWKVGPGALDVGYAHIFVKDSSFCYTTFSAPGVPQQGPCGTVPAALQVQVQGTYKNSVDIIGVQYSLKF
jgi:long-chain fatty acid transport protein